MYSSTVHVHVHAFTRLAYTSSTYRISIIPYSSCRIEVVPAVVTYSTVLCKKKTQLQSSGMSGISNNSIVFTSPESPPLARSGIFFNFFSPNFLLSFGERLNNSPLLPRFFAPPTPPPPRFSREGNFELLGTWFNYFDLLWILECLTLVTKCQ